MRQRFEKPQRGSGLTVEQHIWPGKSIERFQNTSGMVQVFDKRRGTTRLAKWNDHLFCAKRVWDQRAEAGYMKQIEDAFQELAARVVEGNVTTIDRKEKQTVDAFLALWRARADFKAYKNSDIQLSGVTGENMTRDQEETLERNGVAYVRAGGKMPSRILNGIYIQKEIDAVIDHLAGVKWEVLRAQDGTFIVPDNPPHPFIPLTPTLCLCSNQIEIMTKQMVAELNRRFGFVSVEYYFAQDLAACP